MENRAYALITGLFILVLGSAVVGGVLWLGSSAEALSPYVVVSDDSVSGLVEHSTVMYRGVHVGQVSSMREKPETPCGRNTA